jgi:hypothetical protein
VLPPVVVINDDVDDVSLADVDIVDAPVVCTTLASWWEGFVCTPEVIEAGILEHRRIFPVYRRLIVYTDGGKSQAVPDVRARESSVVSRLSEVQRESENFGGGDSNKQGNGVVDVRN